MDKFLGVVVGGFVVAFLLIAVMSGSAVNPAPLPVKPMVDLKAEMPKEEEQGKVEKKAKDEGGSCMPCVGPHYSLTTGRIRLLSSGPGIDF